MEDFWEPYKDIMKRLFLTEDKTYDEVMRLMEQGEYKFRARYSQSQIFQSCYLTKFVNSKAQYERQFGKWNFRKNRKQHDWASASRIIKRRKRDGKDSNVYIDGVLLAAKKVRKESSRNDRPPYGQDRVCHNS